MKNNKKDLIQICTKLLQFLYYKGKIKKITYLTKSLIAYYEITLLYYNLFSGCFKLR